MTMDIDEYVTSAVRAYVECGLWSEGCRGDVVHSHNTRDPRDCDASLEHIGFTIDEVSAESIRIITDEVRAWVATVAEECVQALVIWDAGQFGHDFWLTRNGHGTGYWDRYWDGSEAEKIGDWLTANSRPYGECRFYVDCGIVHYEV